MKLMLDEMYLNENSETTTIYKLEKKGKLVLCTADALYKNQNLTSYHGKKRVAKAESFGIEGGPLTLGDLHEGVLGRSKLGKGRSDEFKRILFPKGFRKNKKRSDEQDVRHITCFDLSDADIFLTEDKDFLNHAKELKEMGVIVMNIPDFLKRHFPVKFVIMLLKHWFKIIIKKVTRIF